MSTSKPFQDLPQLIQTLADRGLGISDIENTILALEEHGYHRLGGYRYVFRKLLPPNLVDRERRIFRSEEFYDGATFDDVEALARFDARLRHEVLAGTEELEIRLRAAIAHQLARKDPYAHLKLQCLSRHRATRRLSDEERTVHDKFIEKVKNAQKLAKNEQDDFVTHHLQKWNPEWIPVWAIVEYLDFGTLYYLLTYLTDDDQRKVANRFGFRNPAPFVTVVRAIVWLRNKAAHGSRLFNRKMKYKLVLWQRDLLARDEFEGAWTGNGKETRLNFETDRIFLYLSILAYMLHQHPSPSKWSENLKGQIERFPQAILGENQEIIIAPETVMHFPETWRELAVWSDAGC